MSNKWCEIPIEIFKLIFCYLLEHNPKSESRRDLCQCALTCRSWRAIVRPVACSDVYLKKIEDLEKKVVYWKLNGHSLGKFTKRLNIDFKVDNDSILNFTDALFPMLEQIIFWGYTDYTCFCKMIIVWKISKFERTSCPGKRR
jgi:hypothetical protein